MDGMVHDMEFIIRIGFKNGTLYLFQTEQRPAVQFFHILISYTVGLRIEIIKIPQKVAKRISDLSVYIAHGFHNLIGKADVSLIIDGRNPQTHHVSAILINNVLGRDYVSYRFGHLPSLSVHGKTMGQNSLIRRAAIDCHTGQKRAVEPAAVLVGTFQIQIAGIRRAGIFPHRMRVF